MTKEERAEIESTGESQLPATREGEKAQHTGAGESNAQANTKGEQEKVKHWPGAERKGPE